MEVSETLIDTVQSTREEMCKKYHVSPARWETKQTLEALEILRKVLNKEKK